MKLDLGGWFGGLFAVAWIGVVVFVDGATAFGAWRMAQSANWPTTPGTVTESRLESRRKSVALVLRYTYTLGRREYTGTRYEDGPTFLPKETLPKVQSELPVGSGVTVYYDPADPATAVLRPGLRPDILPTALALVPFNMAALLFGGSLWNAVRHRREFDPARDVRLAPTGLAVRLNSLGRLTTFAIALLGFSFAGIFVVAALLHSTWEVPPSWLLDGAIFVGMVLVSGLIAAKWGGPRYLVEGLNGFTVPTTPTGRTTVDLPRAAVKHVDVQAETRRRGKGGTYTVHVVSLLAVEGTERRTIKIAEYRELVDARALADWVLERIGKKRK